MKSKLFTALLLTLVVCLCLVSCGKTNPPAAPTNVSYNGTHITWNASANADSYLVQINDGEAYTVKSTVYPYDAAGTAFKVTVKAVIEDKKTVESEPTSVDFKPLGTISNVEIKNDGSLEWSMINLATAYSIKIDGEDKGTVTTTKYDQLPVGKHSVQIRPVISGDASYYSSWSQPVTVEILGTVAKEDITFDPDGYIKWKYVAGAKAYEVCINGVPVTPHTTNTQIAYNANNTSFEVTVKAIGDLAASVCDGKVSETKEIKFLSGITNLKVVDGKLIWDAVAGATGYKIKLNNVVYNKVLTTNEFTEMSLGTPTDVSIMPISDDAMYFSSWSDSKNFLLLTAPIIRWNDYGADGEANSNIFWDGIAGATGYKAIVYFSSDPTADPEKVDTNPYESPSLGETQRFFQEAFLETGVYVIKVKALAPDSTGTIYDSPYSEPIKVIRLDAPKLADSNPITSDPNYLAQGFTVNFQQVAGAFQYNLYKDGVLNTTIPGNSNQITVKDLASNKITDEQVFNYSIQTVGSGAKVVNGQTVVTLNSLTERSVSFQITVLATPTAPTIDGFTYQYGLVDKAKDGYIIDIGGESYASNGNTYDLSTLEAGTYNAKVCAKGNGSTILPSNYSAPISIQRLAAPTNVHIATAGESEGTLTFNSVFHATGYVVVFDNDGNPIPVDTISNMNQYIKEEGTTVYMQSTANYFNDDKTVYYMTSQPGTTTNFMKLAAPTFGDVAFNGNKLVWNAPSNINTQSYTPTYEVYGAGDMLYSGEKSGTSMDISFLEGGRSYEFQVKAIGDGTQFINSDKSITVTVRKLGVPDVKGVKGGYKWNSIAGTVNYKIYVDGELVKTIAAGEELFYAPLFTEIKTYHVEVVAVGDGGYSTIDSNPCTIEQQTKQLQTPDFSLSYSADHYTEDGVINVTITNESPYANGYAYTVGGATYEVDATTYSYNPNSTGSFAVRVYAKGGNFDEAGIYYLNSQSQGGSSRYTITLLGSPNVDDISCGYDGLVKWTPVGNASKYEVDVIVNGTLAKTVTSFGASFGLGDNGIEVKSNDSLTLVIRAIGNGTTIINSKPVEKTMTISR